MSIFRKKKIIYTANFGNYDERHDGADVYFNEENNLFDGSGEHLSQRYMGKLYKILNPLSYDIWIDASVEILKEKEFRKLFKGDFCIFKHRFNKTMKDELDLCEELGYLNSRQKEVITELYNSAGMYVEEVPVYASGILFHSKNSLELEKLWWSLICQYSYRDQLTLPYAIKQFPELDFRVIDIDTSNNEIFKVHSHKKSRN